jgi:hypothetical protein
MFSSLFSSSKHNCPIVKKASCGDEKKLVVEERKSESCKDLKKLVVEILKS